MLKGIQDKFLNIGRSGCYFLCLLEIAELECAISQNILTVYEIARDEGFIKENCFVKDGKSLLETLTNKMWFCRFEKADYKPQHGEWVVKCWEQKVGNGALTHFTLFDENDIEVFDPLRSSPVRKFGKVRDTRVYCSRL